jgi:S-adenosylmethionine decarboxylase
LPVLLSPKQLYAIDAVVTDAGLLTDPVALGRASRAAVAAGGGHVLDESVVVFPNGAVTLVLVLAESHFSIHTWPEELLLAADLFSCGAIDGGRVIASLTAELRLTGVVVRRVSRGVGGGDGG